MVVRALPHLTTDQPKFPVLAGVMVANNNSQLKLFYKLVKNKCFFYNFYCLYDDTCEFPIGGI